MKTIINLIAVLIVIGWVIGFVGYSMGGLFHVLLAVAAIIGILGILQGKKS